MIARNFFLDLVVAACFTSTGVLGGVVPGRWEKLNVLEPGSKILLSSQAGDRMRYTFKGADSTSVMVRDRNGRELIIPKSHVVKIVKQNSRRSKPAWIGAEIGAGAGFAIGYFTEENPPDEVVYERAAQPAQQK